MVIDSNIRQRMEKILAFLNHGLYGKEEAVRLSLLSVISGESIFFLGPTGTGKSMISRRLRYIFKGDNLDTGNYGAKYFEYLLNEFSTPDEIFGPVSLRELENDNYVRKIEGYLPDADIAFLDEIWKAGPAILNTLLSIINERKFHNGKNIVNVPLKSLVVTSNELPAESKGLDALWDRLILRVAVNPVSDEDCFFDMVTQDSKIESRFLSEREKIKSDLVSLDELKHFRSEIDEVIVPESIKRTITYIRKELVQKNTEPDRPKDQKYYVSDRRWKKIINILRTSAYLNNRQEVDIMDAGLIADCVWDTEEQREEVKTIVHKLIEDYGLELDIYIDDIKDAIKEFEDKINITWYKSGTKGSNKSEPVVKLNPNNYEEYYKVKNDSGEKFYFPVPKSTDYYKRYTLYDVNWHTRLDVTNVNVASNKKFITTNGGKFTIEWSLGSKDPKGLIRNQEIFDIPDVYVATKEKFDKEHYKPILEIVESERNRLDNYKKEQESSFLSNLFVERSFADIILTKIEMAKKGLEDVGIKLDKAQSRYKK